MFGLFKQGLLALAAAGVFSGAFAQTPAEEKLRALMQRPAAGALPGASTAASAAPPSAERMRARDALLQQGERALADGRVAEAEQAFDRAAMMFHAADTEMGLVRTYMQSGQYRRALAFGAHTAGAHLDVVGGAALYAWLLHLGGQEAVAQRLLTAAKERAPRQPLVADVDSQLRSPAPRAHGAMLRAPARLAPYGSMQGLPADARVASSATLIGQGQFALVPEKALGKSGRYWVRNGLGQLTAAQAEPGARAHGLVLLRLATPLPTAALPAAPADAFPGSVAFAVEYANAPDAAPAWPILRAGFLGGAIGDSAARTLGVPLAPESPHGGPVFDHAGRLTGVAVHGKAGASLVAASQLRGAFGKQFEGPADAAAADAPANQAAPKRTPDAIYEPALLAALQFIRRAPR
jgi:hypothetical protein